MVSGWWLVVRGWWFVAWPEIGFVNFEFLRATIPLTMPTRGLVVGKFHPPHRGHKYVIDSGMAQCDELHVIVCKKPREEPRGELRAAWMQEMHPTARVMLIEDPHGREYAVCPGRHARGSRFARGCMEC